MNISNKKTFISNSPEETEKIASDLAASCKPGTIIALHGELGAGKTAFAKGFARSIGIKNPISSPTFTVVQEYKTRDSHPKQEIRLFHIDLYRIETEEKSIAFGIEEFLFNPYTFVLIEWAERIPSLLPENTIHITMEYSDANPDHRIITTEGVVTEPE
jgi:tRNA threonylcarbamoyladenosine biosynthesis protein TsaE